MTPSSPPNPVPGWDTLFNAMEPEFPNLVLQQNNLGSVCVCARTHIHTYIMWYNVQYYIIYNIMQYSHHILYPQIYWIRIIMVIDIYLFKVSSSDSDDQIGKWCCGGEREGGLNLTLKKFGGGGIPHFIVLHFIALYKCCISYKLKERPSTRKKTTICFIVILTLLWWYGIKPAISVRYACTRVNMACFRPFMKQVIIAKVGSRKRSFS